MVEAVCLGTAFLVAAVGSQSMKKAATMITAATVGKTHLVFGFMCGLGGALTRKN
jgi:hypothetical protein